MRGGHTGGDAVLVGLAIAVAGVIIIIICERSFRRWRDTHPPRPPRTRPKNARFKSHYGLGVIQPIANFEPALAAAMLAEVNEVFVTAFCTDTIVLNVTASVGTEYRCRASDNVQQWGAKALKLGATQIRQYHSHPDVANRAVPSDVDYRSSRTLVGLVEPYGVAMRSLLVYKPHRSPPGAFAILDYTSVTTPKTRLDKLAGRAVL